MKKRITAVLLTFVMLLGITPITVLAAPVMTVNKTSFVAKERIVVTFTGVTDADMATRPIIHLCNPDQDYGDYIDYWYVNGKGTTTRDFAAPDRDGTYELRFYTDGSYPTSASFVSKTTITVGASASTPVASGMSMKLNKSVFAPKERIIATFTGVTQEDMNTRPIIHLCNPEQDFGDYEDYWYVNGKGTTTRDFAAPERDGTYELRLYRDGSYPTSASFVMKTQITVSSTGFIPLTTGMSMSLNKNVLVPKERIVVTFTGVTQENMDLRPIVHLCQPEQELGDYLDYWYVNGKGTTTRDFAAPDKDGNYELRFYADGSYPTAATYVMKLNIAVGNATLIPDNNTPSVPTIPEIPINTVDPDPTVPVTPPVQNNSFTTLAVATGVKLAWNPIPGAIGYRVYRSTVPGVEGISITDFAINSTSHVDVNVDAKTTYYYTLRALMKEANALTGERETLSPPSQTVSVTTVDKILGGGASDMFGVTKNVILMKINDPFMSVNGNKVEIDPGRGTAPQIIYGRTIVPIRAIIEAMNGTVTWEDATQKITLKANDHSVTMWLNKKDLIVDGNNQTMDVAPVSVNGRTMVPVRFAAENVGCVVDWIASTSEIVVVFYS